MRSYVQEHIVKYFPEAEPVVLEEIVVPEEEERHPEEEEEDGNVTDILSSPIKYSGINLLSSHI